jgi:hypothetical protein
MKKRPFFRWLLMKDTLLNEEWLQIAKELEEANVSKKQFKEFLAAKKCEKEKNSDE